MDSNLNVISTLDQSIDNSFEILMTVFVNNDFDSVICMSEPFVENSVFHSAIKSKISMLKAGLTLDKNDLDHAQQSVKQTLSLCDRLRRKKLFSNLSAKFSKTSCDKYTDLELHAELTHAIIIGCTAALDLLQCHNMKKLAKIVYKISVCMKSFKLCRLIYEKRTKWQSPKSKSQFEAGISLERGFRHLIVSYLPPKLLKIINFLGYRGVREIAFRELNKTAFDLTGIYSVISELVLIIYWLYIEVHTSIGPKNIQFFRQLVDKKLSLFPNSLLYRAANAKLIQLNGAIDMAVDEYNKIINLDKQLFHKFAHFELLFCFAVKCDWSECIKYSALLRKHTLHSPSITTYLEAVFRYVYSIENNDEDNKTIANELFKTVPSLRIRYLGKTITFEKAVVVFSQRYFQNDQFMLLPVLEILYQVNYIYLLNGNNELTDTWIKRVDQEIEKHGKEFVLGKSGDNYLTSLFYKAILFKQMGNLIEAQQYLKAIINQKFRIENNQCLVPQTLLELALIEMNLNNKQNSKLLLDTVLKKYSRYTTENLVHIRAYSALREMGFNTDKLSDDLYDEYGDNSDINQNEIIQQN